MCFQRRFRGPSGLPKVPQNLQKYPKGLLTNLPRTSREPQFGSLPFLVLYFRVLYFHVMACSFWRSPGSIWGFF